ncbi:MAG: DUF2189 domain-containing protein [Gammaproteobacteria bacterium]|jgi:uncharacterized membrane protein
MSKTETEQKPQAMDPDALPFVAPCRTLQLSDPWRWVKRGWEDFRQAPGPSLWYGGVLVLISYALALVTWKLGGYILILSMMSGFVFIAPVLAVGLYSISCQLQRGLDPQIGYCLREGRRHLGDELVFSMIMLVIFLVWARAASMVHVFFPMESEPQLTDLALFLGVGSAVGAVFAGLVFSASAFSLPMMLDRKVDTVTAVLTSVNAVLRNKGPMLIWAMIIVTSVALSFATAFLGLAVLMPVIGYATWHGYRDSIQAEQWPENDKLPESD